MIAWLLACAQAPADTAAGLDTGAALPVLVAPTEGPSWTAEEAAEAWGTALAGGFPDPGHAHDVYLEMMSHGDDACPGDATQLSDDVVLGCTATSGYYYSGVSEYRSSETTADGVTSGFHGVHGDFRLETPDAVALRVGGTCYQEWALGATESSFVEGFEGTWIWEGDDGPFAAGVSGRMDATLLRDPDGTDGDSAAFVGALAFGGVSFATDDLVVTGAGCATGTLRLRDPGGAWDSLAFDGCDGCAEVLDPTTGSLGQACLDLAPLAGLPAARLGPR